MKARISELIAKPYRAVHRDIRAGRHREYWLAGGRGSGKSSFISLEILLGLVRDRNANAIVYRKTAATLRESVMEQMLWAAEALGIGAYFRMRAQQAEMEYLPTGQRILFRGASEPGKSKSIKLAKGYFRYLWFEEVDEFAGMEDIRSIKVSVLRGGAQSCSFFTYNPPAGMRCWVNREALVPRADRLAHSCSYLDLPREWLGGDFIAEAELLKETNPRAYRHVYLGEITGSDRQVFDNLRIGPISQEEIDQCDRALCGLDVGFAADPDAFIRAHHDPRTGRITVLDEFCAVRTPVETLCAEVARRCGGAVVRCDSAEPRMIRELRERGVQALGAKKGPGSVQHGLRWLQERSEIRIDPARCPNAAREFAGYEYPDDGNGGIVPEAPDRDNHLIDALRDALEPVIARRDARSLDRRALGI